MPGKALIVGMLKPFAHLAGRVADPARRAWAHARLAARLPEGLDPSVVVMGVPEIHGTARIRLGRSLLIYPGLYLETQEEGAISIGDRVTLSRGVHVVAYDRLEIGPGAIIGEYTSIRDANHHIESGVSWHDSGYDRAPITIGADVWIGHGAIVLPGVRIGDGAVVGANAVVNRDVPAGAVVGGVPARVLRAAGAPRRAPA